LAGSSRLTLMVVDDQALFRRALEDRLRSEGFTVLGAENGREALDLLERSATPCLVLLDVVMPVMNGVEFLHALDRRRDTDDVRVVLLSAYEVVDQVAQHSPRIVGRLHKPVDLAELRHAIQAQAAQVLAGAHLPN
jgi:CheY-like chemotaxis protein